MPRLINLADHKNLWGTTISFEPQRSDLWLVDLTQLVNGLNSQGVFEALGLADAPKFYPQFVQSVTLPELKMKAEVFRRDSVPYNMPSWDEPLDPVKISFLVDTYDNPNQSVVLSVLQAWQAIVRAGRGDRSSLYNGSVKLGDFGYVPLNANYRYDYAFPIRVAQLRGGSTEANVLTFSQVSAMNQNIVNQSNLVSAQQNSLQAATGTMPTFAQLTAPASGPVRNTAESGRPLATQPWLAITSNWLLSNAWLGGWKMSDLSYVDSKLMIVEATIYAEDLFQVNV